MVAFIFICCYYIDRKFNKGGKTMLFLNTTRENKAEKNNEKKERNFYLDMLMIIANKNLN